MTAVPARVWVDNGPASWPPAGWHGLDERDWPRTFEAWVKWDDEGERRRVRQRQETVVCDTSLMEEHHGKWYACGRRCGAVLTSMRAAPAHQREAHRYWDRATGWHLQPLRFVPKSPRWIWELLGFADLWDGRPRGWYEVLDGAEVRDRAYEADALVLGDRVACYLRLEVAS